ncbi:MAG: AAA family ATPase [Chloracidobacterium sp.]|nr:AAA family ATPase [Chloracidobacterium sp.]
MHDSFSKDEGQNIRQASRINDCFANSKDFVPPGMLFGEFWCEGEMALLFGATGTGKSILALQIADAAARGRGVEAFNMEAKRQKVLYVDLALSNAQLQMRYTHAAKHYEFSRNLYRERPASNDKLCAWLRERINDNGYK